MNISLKDLYKIENDIGTTSNEMYKIARNSNAEYSSIAQFSTFCVLLLLSLSVGLFFNGNIASAMGCFTGFIISLIISKLSFDRARYYQIIILSYAQKEELNKFKKLME